MNLVCKRCRVGVRYIIKWSGGGRETIGHWGVPELVRGVCETGHGRRILECLDSKF